MTLSVIDSAPLLRAVLDAAPSDREDAVRTLWAPVAAMYQFVPGGVDMAAVHRQSSGFALDAPEDDARVRAAVETLVEADAWTRARTALTEAVAALRAADPGATVPDVTLLIVVGDPADPHFTDEMQGLSAFGGISGFVTLTLWPTARVLARIEAIVAHEVHHNLRYSPGGVVWDPATVTVGEHVVAEGLADAFAAELHGPLGHTHVVDERTRADDAVLAAVSRGLGITGMADLLPWVLGDSTAVRLGAAPVGLPTGAGYAAGVRLVQAYLDRTGTTAAQNLRTPSSDILAVALPTLGLAPSAAD